MSYFLWIEDFESSAKTTASNLFAGLMEEQYFSDNTRQLKKDLSEQGVFIELSFQDGLAFIREKLNDIDYIILDIDLPAYSRRDSINGDVMQLLERYYGYKKQDDESEDERFLGEKCNDLKKLAGYHLYAELVIELGFPKQHILFCSNHGENLKSIKDAFITAKISLPPIYTKAHDEPRQWIEKNYENAYSRLRRGIIEGCRYLKNLSEENVRFNKFISDSEKHISLDGLHDYLEVLHKLLPLSEPENDEAFSLYRLLISVLAHEWEAAEPKPLGTSNGAKRQELFAFSWIMKMTRNWSAHGKVFAQLNPQDVAYLFIVNMRAMFELGDSLLSYEKYLLQLFKTVLTESEFKEKIGKDHSDRKIPLIENYAQMLDKSGNTYQAINFHDILNGLQRSRKETDHEFLMIGLYQVFWFLTSSGQVYIPPDKDRLKSFKQLNYQFKYFNYAKEEYLFEIGRYIFNSSFIEEKSP